MTPRPQKVYWRICCILAAVLMVLAFSPVLLPAGQIDPTLFGMPFILWVGILLCVIMVVLTYLATLVHPGRYSDSGDIHPQP